MSWIVLRTKILSEQQIDIFECPDWTLLKIRQRSVTSPDVIDTIDLVGAACVHGVGVSYPFRSPSNTESVFCFVVDRIIIVFSVPHTVSS